MPRSRDVDSACNVLLGRLHALARAQEFVVEGSSGGVPLRELIEADLEAFGGRISVEGIPVILGGAFAQHFALVIHELGTNAAKYGALSVPEGRVDVSWKLLQSEEPLLSFLLAGAGRTTGGSTNGSGVRQPADCRVFWLAADLLHKRGSGVSAEIPFSEITRASK